MIYLGIVEQEKIDPLVTMHTSIARGDVRCKYQIFPALHKALLKIFFMM